jgi:N-methylhydantoinase A
VFAELLQRANNWFNGERTRAVDRRYGFAIDMRYKGQSHELRIAMPGENKDHWDEHALRDAFLAEHERTFGFAADKPIELVTFRISASTPNHRRPPDLSPESADKPVVIQHRQVWFESPGGFVHCPIYNRVHVKAGTTIEGPAIIEQMDSTLVVTGGDLVTSLEAGNLLLRLG